MEAKVEVKMTMRRATEEEVKKLKEKANGVKENKNPNKQ